MQSAILTKKFEIKIKTVFKNGNYKSILEDENSKKSFFKKKVPQKIPAKNSNNYRYSTDGKTKTIMSNST